MRPVVKLSQFAFDLEPEPSIVRKTTCVVRLDCQFDSLDTRAEKCIDSFRAPAEVQSLDGSDA